MLPTNSFHSFSSHPGYIVVFKDSVSDADVKKYADDVNANGAPDPAVPLRTPAD